MDSASALGQLDILGDPHVPSGQSGALMVRWPVSKGSILLGQEAQRYSSG